MTSPKPPPLLQQLAPTFTELSAIDQKSVLHHALDLAELFAQGVPELEFQTTPRLGDRVFYRAGAHLLAGHPKEGKSWLLLLLILDTLKFHPDTVCVVWDFENGHRRFLRRLVALGVDPVLLGRIRYIRSPAITRETFVGELHLLARVYPGAMLAVDSLRGLLGRLGAKENDADDIEKALQPLDDVATDERLLVAILDHVTKETNASSRYAGRGSGAKLAAVTAGYYVEKAEPFSVHEQGIVKLHVNHDRDGGLSAEFAYEIGGQGEDDPLHFESLDPSAISGEGRAREAVEAFLRENAGTPLTQSVIDAADIGGSRTERRKAVKALVEDAESPVRRVEGVRKNSWQYVYGPEKKQPGI